MTPPVAWIISQQETARRRAEAKQLGLVHYVGNPCKQGHDGKRYASTSHCVECQSGWPPRRRKYEQTGKYKAAKRKYARSEDGKASQKARSHKHRAANVGVGGTFTPQEEQRLRERQKKCHICKRRFTKKNPATLDHVIAVTRDGPNLASNIALAHRSCNSSKGNRITHLI